MLEPGFAIGPYEVVAPIKVGETGFADLYAGRLAQSGKAIDASGGLVVLKIARTPGPLPHEPERQAALAATYNDALRQEVALLRRLQHPGIRRVLPMPLGPGRVTFEARALALPGAPWYCAMEYLPGGSLSEWIEGHPQLPRATALDIVKQVALVLSYLHEQGIVHCDVKPGNILLRQKPTPGEMPEIVLSDFGAAGRVGRVEARAATARYAAPEQRRGGALAPPVDVYALSAVLHRLLTGRSLDPAADTPLPLLSEWGAWGPSVAELLRRGLARDPAQRPSADSFAQLLARLEQEATAT